ncbi:hypothetical protein NKH70_29875 [Mesorhizobium sp. M0991]|uniref:hypothetical protein n=1 Tax=Mesorhizobium sp. M0991 TaxID=2957043 RepID=UPI003335FB08
MLDWSAQPTKKGPTITFRLKSNLQKAVRSISATLVFDDARGNRLAELPLSPGLKIAADVEGAADDVILDPRMNTELQAAGVKATICTRYVEYTDGGFEEY